MVKNLEKSEKNPKKEKENKTKSSLIKIYVIIVVFAALTSQVYSLGIIILSTKVLRIKNYLQICTLLHLPQIIIYLYISLKNEK